MVNSQEGGMCNKRAWEAGVSAAGTSMRRGCGGSWACSDSFGQKVEGRMRAEELKQVNVGVFRACMLQKQKGYCS